MPGFSWTTPSQRDWLTGEFPAYVEAQKNKSYKDFWPGVFESWFSKWPEIGIVFPGKTQSELTEAELTKLGTSIAARKKRLKTWFRWRVNGKAKAGRRGRRSVGLDDFRDLGGNSRQLKDYEMFSRLYYAEKVRPVVKEELARLAADGEKLSRGETLSLIKLKLRDVYRNESEEIKNEVRVKLEEYAKTLGDLKDQDPNDVSDRSATQYLDAIQACPNFLTRTFEPLAKKTGWAFTILCGGPDPMDNGKLAVASVHVGETEAGANFSHVYKSFSSAVLDPYGAFLEKVFPKAVQQSRSIQNSLIPMKEGDDDVDGGSESEATDEEDELDEEGNEDEHEEGHILPLQEVRLPSIPKNAPKLPAANSQQDLVPSLTILDQNDASNVRAEEEVQTPGDTAGSDTTASKSDITTPELLLTQTVAETTNSSGFYRAQDSLPSMDMSDIVDPNINWDIFNQMITNILSSPTDHQTSLSGFDPTLAAPSNDLLSFPHVDVLTVTPGLAPLVHPPSHSTGSVADSTASSYVADGNAAAPGVLHDQGGSAGCNAPPMSITLQQTGPATDSQVLAQPDHAHAPLPSQMSINLQPATPATVSQALPQPDHAHAPLHAPLLPQTSISLQQAAPATVPQVLPQPGHAHAPLHAPLPPQTSISPQRTAPAAVSQLLHQPGHAYAPLHVPLPQTQPSISLQQAAPTTPLPVAAQPDHVHAPLLPQTSIGPQQTAPATISQVPPHPDHSHAPLHAPLLPQTSISLQQAAPATISQVLPQPDHTHAPLHAPPFSLTSITSHQTAMAMSCPVPPLSDQPSALLPSHLTGATPIPLSSLPLGESSGENRRSSRAVIPSKRLEKMNEIGENTVAANSNQEKEDLAPGQVPDWASLAKSHLLDPKLGVEWTSCIEGWLYVEEQLAYGTKPGCKGHLPATERPAEWSRWASKAKNGVRNYEAPPTWSDPAEFGAALQKWWYEIQPAFRKSASGKPAPIFVNPGATLGTDDWKELRKGGPNGLVVLITMLCWWGQSLERRTQWQTDSSTDWKAMVVDVSLCLRSIAASIPVSKKRKTTGGVKEKSKRVRI